MADTRAFSEGDHSLTEAASRMEQAKLLYSSPAVLLVNLFNAFVAATLLWSVYPIAAVGAWLGMFFVVIPARLYLWHRFRTTQPEKLDPQAWCRLYTFGSIATGLLWGLLSSVVFVTSNPVYYVVTAFVVGGMTAGAALRGSAYLPSFYGFAVAASFPIVFAFLVAGGYALLELGLLVAAFVAVLILSGRSYNRWIMENIGLRHVQSTLNESLQHTTLELRREIDQREQISTALQESNERFRGIGESAQDAVVITDSDGNVSYWNPAAGRIFGYAPEEIMGCNVHEKIASERDRAKALEGYKRFAETGKGYVLGRTLTLQAVRKDGSEFPIELSVSAMNLSGRRHALGIARDVTDRVRAEGALRDREAELREAQRVAHIGNWVWNPRTRVMHWSRELYRLFGVDGSLPAPDLQGYERFLTPESFSRLSDAFAACSATGAPYEIDLDIARPDGTKIWLAARGEAERDGDGNIVRIRGTVQDITERKNAEQKIADLHEKMAANVETMRRHELKTGLVARLSDILQSCHTRDEAYPVIADVAKNLFPGTNGALSLVSTEKTELETVAQWGGTKAMSSRFALDDCWGLRTGRRHDVDAAEGGALCRHFESPPAGPYFCLPLVVLGETTGLLHVNAPAGTAIDEEFRRLALSFGDVIKLSLSNLRLRETLSEQALRDQLTTLFNRHYLSETLPREIRRAERDNVPLSIAILDIDHFKRLNDTQGHGAGDQILKDLGSLMRDMLRAGDIACRYGGEEFFLLLPECDSENAKLRVQQVCLAVKLKTFTYRGTALPQVTFSAGISQLSEDLSTAEALIAAADRALYAAKSAGRDRVEVFTPQIGHLPSKSAA